LDPAVFQAAGAEPISWQGSDSAMPIPPTAEESTIVVRSSPADAASRNEVGAPLLDDGSTYDQRMPLGDTLGENYEPQRRGVRPYGGGHPWDWPWGCGGSPYRTGPGMCDNWRVGCRWHVAVDGMVMHREDANLGAIWNATDAGQQIPDLFEQFDYAPGGRVSFIGYYPRCAGYAVHAGFEGIEKWEAAIIYPKDEDAITIPDPDGTGPLGPISVSEQRRINYTSNLYSGELNILKCHTNSWRPFCGVRYIKFDDELRIFDDQEALGPLDVLPMVSPDGVLDPAQVLTTDMTNLFDLENNLMGFQIGLRHDWWQLTRRFGIEGFMNGGVYYNKVKYTNLMNVTTTQRIGSTAPASIVNTTIPLTSVTNTTGIPGTSEVVSATNMDTSDLSEIAYSWEASLSGVFRINKCWQMRAGYQVLWINGLRLADQGLLNPDDFTGNSTSDLLFHGWHAGIECRR
jgi:hypothetical protein